MKSYKARGIVLHSARYGETAVILYLLTDVIGRQTYMVQGVRGSKSKGNKAALFQPMFVLEYVGLESPKMEMHRMKDVRNALVMTSLPFDIRKSTISLFMAEVLYRLIREPEPDSPLFDFVCGSVEALDAMSEGVANFHLWFLVKLSYYLGFYPGNEWLPGGRFDIEEGLFIPGIPKHSLTFDAGDSELLGKLMALDAGELASLRLAREQRSSFLNSMLLYFGYHLDSVKEVRSVSILRDIF